MTSTQALVFYFDNIAEVYDKMNEHEKACEWAKEAKRRGSDTEIVNTILAKYKKMSNFLTLPYECFNLIMFCPVWNYTDSYVLLL